jgi:hypothetical protein
MKYCPQCNREYTEPWLTFCADDGTMLIEELAPPVDPNWNPVIREPQVKPASEQETQWLPRQPPMAGGWVAPDERPPMTPVWQPPPPPPRPVKQPSQGLAVASLVTGLLGLVLSCFGPLPAMAAIVLGSLALIQIKKSPEATGGKPLAITGIVTGSLVTAFWALMLLWWILAGVLGNL